MTIPIRKIVYAALGALFPGATVVYALPAENTGPVPGVNDKCVAAGATLNGIKVELYNRNSGTQIWNVGTSATSAPISTRTKIQLYDCNGSRAQKWIASNGDASS